MMKMSTITHVTSGIQKVFCPTMKKQNDNNTCHCKNIYKEPSFNISLL